MNYVIMLILAFWFTSCQDFKKNEQLSKIRRLEQKTAKIPLQLNKIQEETLNDIIQNVGLVELKIRESYMTDTIDKSLAGKLTEYKMIRKQLKPMLTLKAQVRKEALEEEKALKKLEKDISNAAGDKSKYDEYIRFETEKVEKLNTLADDMLKTQDKCKASFDKLHWQLVNYSEKLNEKKTHL